jgi:predicted RNA-binding protein YlqC (UPF0109 family)
MRTLIETITRAIVGDDPNLRVDVTESRYQTTLTVTAHEDAVGRLVGKKGRTIQAIRNLAEVVGEREGTHYNIWIEGSYGPSLAK